MHCLSSAFLNSTTPTISVDSQRGTKLGGGLRLQVLRLQVLVLACVAVVALMVAAVGATPASAQTTWYVDASASGGDGTSWQNAFSSVAPALRTAQAGDAVWVAAGVYVPEAPVGAADPREATFAVPSGVSVYGGFGGGETSVTDRDLIQNATVFSGDRLGNDVDTGSAERTPAARADNAYHVVTLRGASSSTRLDGLTIRGGEATAAPPHDRGGGLYVEGGSPTLVAVTVHGNRALRGGGAYHVDASPVYASTVFSANEAVIEGGAVVNVRSNAELHNVTVAGNRARRGGAMVNEDASPLLANSIFWDNDTAPGGTPDSPFRCERQGYPCSLNEASSTAVDRSLQVGDGAVQEYQSSSGDEAIDWLRTQPDVAEIRPLREGVIFRTIGAPPVWVDWSGRASGTTGTTPASASARKNASPGLEARPRSVAPKVVVGRDPKQKRALVLAPYYWEFEPFDESPQVAAALESARGYRGNVRYVANLVPQEQTVAYADFLGWDAYDTVLLATHGDQVCTIRCTNSANCPPDSSCERSCFSECPTVILTGLIAEEDAGGTWVDQTTQQPLPKGVGIRIPAIGSGLRDVYLSDEWFRTIYPNGIDDTIILFAGCRTSRDPAFLQHVNGSTGVAFGWTDYVNSDVASGASVRIFEDLITDGIPTQSAYDAIVEDGDHIDPKRGATLLRFGPSGQQDLRIREIVTLLNPDTEAPLQENDPAFFVVGTPGDGQPDRVPFLIEVEGVEASPNLFQVQFRVENIEGMPLALSSGTAMDAEQNVWRVRGEIEVPDLSRTDPVELSAWVEPLPDAGRSEHTVNVRAASRLTFVSEITFTNDISITSRVEGRISVNGSEGTLTHTFQPSQIQGADGSLVTITPFDGAFAAEGLIEAADDTLRISITDPPEETYTAQGFVQGPFTQWLTGFAASHGTGRFFPSEWVAPTEVLINGCIDGTTSERPDTCYDITGWTRVGDQVWEKTYTRSFAGDDGAAVTESTVLRYEGVAAPSSSSTVLGTSR